MERKVFVSAIDHSKSKRSLDDRYMEDSSDACPITGFMVLPSILKKLVKDEEVLIEDITIYKIPESYEDDADFLLDFWDGDIILTESDIIDYTDI